MKGLHPNSGPFALALLCALAAVGCSHNPSGITNPFLAPDRVAPPSTRAIAPGTAEPYYPGDPLPVMQSAAPAAATIPSVAAAVPPPSIRPSPTSPPIEPKAIAFSNELRVAVPSDDSSLRFELPKPPDPELPPTVVAITPASSGPPTAPQTSPNVVPAIYNSPPINGQPLNQVSQAAALTDPAIATPWRSPQIPNAEPAAYFPVGQQIQPPMVAQPAIAPGYVFVPSMTPAAPSMDVSLRAVPSPPPAPLDSSAPRIRLPGYPAPFGTLPPPTSSSGISPDGFRPRSSMR